MSVHPHKFITVYTAFEACSYGYIIMLQNPDSETRVTFCDEGFLYLYP